MDSLARYSDRIEAIVSSGDYFSIDIFDTLIFRLCPHPADVFRIVERCCPEAAAIGNFIELRLRAEELARRVHISDTQQEVTHEQIYKLVQTLADVSEAKCDAIRRAEVAVEIMLCYPSSFGTELLSALRARGKRYVLASDMYLPRATIEDILDRSGISGHEYLFLSSETKRSKHAGDMYVDIARHFRKEPGRITHVGDNPHADGEMALVAGFKSFLFTNERLQFASSNDIYRAASVRGTSNLRMLFLSQHLQSCVDRGLDSWNIEEDGFYWETFGRVFFAPLLVSLTVWLKRACDEEGLTKIAFLARDGLIVKKAFDIIYPDAGIETRYVAASRRMLTLPSRILSPSEISNYYTHLVKSAETGDELLAGIAGGHALRTRLQSLGFDLADPLNRRSRRLLVNAIGENSGLLTQALACERDVAKRYLERELGSSEQEKIGLFDLGWRGSLQAAIARALPEQASDLHGLYFGTTWDAVDLLLREGQTSSAFAMNYGLPEHNRHACQLHTDLIEFLFCAQHGSVEKVVETASGTFEWRYFDVSDAESATQRIAAIVQKEALSAVRSLAAQVGSHGLEMLSCKQSDLTDAFDFMHNPTPLDAQHFAAVRVFSGIGDLVGESLCGRSDGVSVRRDLRKTRWKAGFLAGLGDRDRFELEWSQRLLARGT